MPVLGVRVAGGLVGAVSRVVSGAPWGTVGTWGVPPPVLVPVDLHPQHRAAVQSLRRAPCEFERYRRPAGDADRARVPVPTDAPPPTRPPRGGTLTSRKKCMS